MSTNEFLDTLQSLFYQLQVSRYMAAAGLSIMIYDWALTLSVEVRYIWGAKWTPVKIVFLINRYIMPCTIAFGIYGWSGAATWINHSTCKIYVSVDAYTLIAFFCTLHWLVAMRTWALWSRSLAMGFVIWGSFLLYLGAAVGTAVKAMSDFEPSPALGISVCVGILPDYFWCLWLPSIVFETVLFALTAIKALQHRKKKVETPILTTLYRDGFLYFVFICLNSFMNLLIWAVAPPGYVILYKFFSTSICAIAGAHLILDLIHVGHMTGASQKSGQPPPGIKSFGYAREHGEVFEMMSAPSFMQDPPEYTQTMTIEQAMDQGLHTKSFTNWTAPLEWRSFHGHDHEASVETHNTAAQSRSGLLTESEQQASRDNYSFLPERPSRKTSKLTRPNPRLTSSTSSDREQPGRPRLVISTPFPNSVVKNGMPISPPPPFSTPRTYRAQQDWLREQQLEQEQGRLPLASGSRSPAWSPTNVPGRDRSIKFNAHPYRSSPQAI